MTEETKASEEAPKVNMEDMWYKAIQEMSTDDIHWLLILHSYTHPADKVATVGSLIAIQELEKKYSLARGVDCAVALLLVWGKTLDEIKAMSREEFAEALTTFDDKANHPELDKRADALYEKLRTPESREMEAAMMQAILSNADPGSDSIN